MARRWMHWLVMKFMVSNARVFPIRDFRFYWVAANHRFASAVMRTIFIPSTSELILVLRNLLRLLPICIPLTKRSVSQNQPVMKRLWCWVVGQIVSVRALNLTIAVCMQRLPAGKMVMRPSWLTAILKLSQLTTILRTGCISSR